MIVPQADRGLVHRCYPFFAKSREKSVPLPLVPRIPGLQDSQRRRNDERGFRKPTLAGQFFQPRALLPQQSQGQLAEQIDFTFTDGVPGRMSREEMLMHVITHGIGHRGQVSALMLLNALPPAKDGFTAYLHEAEASVRRRAAD
jgi:hypothetical protein